MFLYHHPPKGDRNIDVDFGVEVKRAFTGDGVVTATPVGEVATAVHRGPYDQMRATHEAIHAWCAAHGREIGAYSIMYLLRY